MRGSRRPSAASMVPVVGLLVVAVSMALSATRTGPPADAQSPSGPDLYAANCASCHQAGGEGIVGTFPPLAGNPAAADPAVVEAAIREGRSGPIDVLGTTYDGVMPPATGLSDPEIAAVVAHVVELAGPSSPGGEPGSTDTADEVVAQPATAGDAARGRRLFAGSRRLDGGAPACGSCHVAGSVGDYGGGVLGPDLTGSFQTLGGSAGLTGWLANPPSATMAPVFAERPLTEPELADLVAFLADAPSQERPASGFDRVMVAVVVGLVALVGVMVVAGRGARKPYVAQLKTQPRAPSRVRPQARLGAQPKSGRSGR